MFFLNDRTGGQPTTCALKTQAQNHGNGATHFAKITRIKKKFQFFNTARDKLQEREGILVIIITKIVLNRSE